MRQQVTTGIALALVLMAGAVYAQEAGQSDVEAAVDALATKYMEAWAAGDPAMMAALYTEDADSVNGFGEMFEGRDAIQESAADILEMYAGSTIDIQGTSAQVVNDAVVIADGAWEVQGATPAEGVPTSGFYTIILTKSGDEWLIRSSRVKVPPPSMPTESPS